MSSFDDYMKAQGLEQMRSKLPVYKGDFLPYVENRYPQRFEEPGNGDMTIDYWGGFYSTRPALKQLIKDVWKLQRSVDSLVAGYRLMGGSEKSKDFKEIQAQIAEAKKLSNLLLHHDAITGTHTLPVKDDFEAKAFKAYKSHAKSASDLFQLLNGLEGGDSGRQGFEFVQKLLGAELSAEYEDLKLVSLYNPRQAREESSV
jgi:hypothetical protein